MDTTYANYLYDLAQRFLSEAIEAKEAYDSLRAKGISPSDCSYESGRALAYYEVLSIVINLAYSFGLDMAVLGLEGINPDELLLS